MSIAGPDGFYHMVATNGATYGGGPLFLAFNSLDLINWSSESIIDGMGERFFPSPAGGCSQYWMMVPSSAPQDRPGAATSRRRACTVARSSLARALSRCLPIVRCLPSLFTGVGNLWAPEWQWDDERQEYMVRPHSSATNQPTWLLVRTDASPARSGTRSL